MPRLSIAVLLLALAALSSTLTYAGFLVVGVISHHLGTSRFLAGLLLAVLFARLPYIRQGRLVTVGLLPRRARLPVLAVLLALCMLSLLYRGAVMPVLFLVLAAALVLTLQWMRRTLAGRAMALFRSLRNPAGARRADETIIDAEFREKKD